VVPVPLAILSKTCGVLYETNAGFASLELCESYGFHGLVVEGSV